MFGANFVRGISEGKHTAILSEIQFFSGSSLDPKVVRNVVARFIYDLEGGRVNELFNLPVIQNESDKFEMGYPAKLLDRVSDIVGKKIASTDLTFDLTNTKGFKTISDLMNLPELSEIREEGFRPIKGNFYVKSNKIVGLDCVLELSKNDAGYLNVVASYPANE